MVMLSKLLASDLQSGWYPYWHNKVLEMIETVVKETRVPGKSGKIQLIMAGKRPKRKEVEKSVQGRR